MADAIAASRDAGAIPAPGLPSFVERFFARDEWKVVGVLPKADPALAFLWWLVLLVRGVLPAGLGVAIGVLVGVVQRGTDLTVPLTFAAIVFLLLQVLAPLHQTLSASLGERTSAWLHDRLAEACVR